MTAKVKASWEYLFPINEIFGEIMIMVGRESLDKLLKCRQVCQKWNMIISEMTKDKKHTIRRKADSSAALIRVEGDFLPDITTAASLFHQGFLGSLRDMTLEDDDLASVPAEHLASLATCVTEGAVISNVACGVPQARGQAGHQGADAVHWRGEVSRSVVRRENSKKV